MKNREANSSVEVRFEMKYGGDLGVFVLASMGLEGEEGSGAEGGQEVGDGQKTGPRFRRWWCGGCNA